MSENKEITVVLTEREQEYLKDVLETEKALYSEQKDYYQTNTALRDINDKCSNCQSVLDKLNDAQNSIINKNAADLQDEIGRMVTHFFLNNVEQVFSDNHEWKIEKGNDVVAEIYHNNQPVCKIVDGTMSFIVTSEYAEMDFVAEYAGKALDDLDYNVYVRDKYYDDELNTIQGNERSR